MKVKNTGKKAIDTVLNGVVLQVQPNAEAEIADATWKAVKNLFPMLAEVKAKEEVKENVATVVKNKKSRK